MAYFMYIISMIIGFASVSSSDSIRSDLIFDEINGICYFDSDMYSRKFNIRLNEQYINKIQQGKRLWITLTQKVPSQINSTTQFDESEMQIQEL